MSERKENYFTFTPVPQTYDGKGMMIEIDYGFYYVSNDADEKGYVSSYIPSMDLFFYSKAGEEKKIAGIVSEGFIMSWVKGESFSSFLRQLKVLGYEPADGILDWNKIKKKVIDKPVTFKPIKAKNTVPENYLGGHIENVHQKLSMAY